MHLPDDFVSRFVTLWLIPLTITVLFCAGCATTRDIPPTDAPLRPSTDLLQVCPEPDGSAETNSAIARWLLAYKAALRECNNQITTFKESPDGNSSKQPG